MWGGAALIFTLHRLVPREMPFLLLRPLSLSRWLAGSLAPGVHSAFMPCGRSFPLAWRDEGRRAGSALSKAQRRVCLHSAGGLREPLFPLLLANSRRAAFRRHSRTVSLRHFLCASAETARTSSPSGGAGGGDLALRSDPQALRRGLGPARSPEPGGQGDTRPNPKCPSLTEAATPRARAASHGGVLPWLPGWVYSDLLPQL